MQAVDHFRELPDVELLRLFDPRRSPNFRLDEWLINHVPPGGALCVNVTDRRHARRVEQVLSHLAGSDVSAPTVALPASSSTVDARLAPRFPELAKALARGDGNTHALDVRVEHGPRAYLPGQEGLERHVAATYDLLYQPEGAPQWPTACVWRLIGSRTLFVHGTWQGAGACCGHGAGEGLGAGGALQVMHTSFLSCWFCFFCPSGAKRLSMNEMLQGRPYNDDHEEGSDGDSGSDRRRACPEDMDGPPYRAQPGQMGLFIETFRSNCILLLVHAFLCTGAGCRAV